MTTAIRNLLARPALAAAASAAALAAAAAMASPPPASAQPAADSAAVLLAAADDFAAVGERDVAEALYRRIARRFPGTPAAEAAAAWLSGAGAAGSGPDRQVGGGETELKVWGTAFGTWLGYTTPASWNASGEEAYGAGLLAGGPAGFFGARALTRRRPVSPGQARAITLGGTAGALQGLAIHQSLGLDGNGLSAMIAGSLVGTAGGVLASRREISSGTATAASLGTFWGAWIGAASVLVAVEDQDLNADRVWLAGMLGGDAGLVAGALAGSRLPLSRSRARLIGVGGGLGVVAGLGGALLAGTDDRATVGLMLGGSVIGLAAGGLLTRGHDAREDAMIDQQEPAAAAEQPATGALVNRANGQWSLSTPLPSPLPTRPGGDLSWRVPLLNLRF